MSPGFEFDRLVGFFPCFAALFLTQATPLAAQELRFEHLTIKDGLSQNSARCIFQDSKGILWIGTYEGLNRYDGYKIITYHHDLDDPDSLSDNLISAITEDGEGYLWVGTRAGLNRFDPQTGNWDRYLDSLESNGLGTPAITALSTDEKGTLWVGTEWGLLRFDAAKDRFIHYRKDAEKPGSLGANRVNAVYRARSGSMWIGLEEGGLQAYDTAEDRFISYLPEPGGERPSSVKTIWEDRWQRLWIATARGRILRLDERGSTWEPFVDTLGREPLLGHQVEACLPDERGVFWIGTSSAGLFRLDPGKGTVRHDRHEPGRSDSLGADAVKALLQDREGTIWVGTNSGGLARYSPYANKFELLVHDRHNDNSLSHDVVLGIYEDSFGYLWVGTANGGLNRYDRDRDQYRRYLHDQNDPQSLPTGWISALLEDSRQHLWVGTEQGLSRFDRRSETFFHYIDAPPLPRVSALLEDSDGMLWITAATGLHRFDVDRNHWTSYRHDPLEPTSLSNDGARALLLDGSGSLWIGTDRGLNRLDRDRGVFTRYLHITGDQHSLSHNMINAICEDEYARLWIATNGGGLNRFDRQTNRFTRYLEKDGLANNTVYSVLPDEDGQLWLSTNKGLSRFDPEREQFRNYDVSDGLLTNEFNIFSWFRSPAGAMYFGGIKGVVSFLPANLPENPHPPPVLLTVLENLGNHGKPLQPLQLTRGDRLDLSFSALSYVAPEKNHYAYMLENFDQDWRSGPERTATYTNLPPGNYRFRVKATNNDGVWTQSETHFDILVPTPYWQTWWAYLLYVLGLLAAVLAVLRLRTHQLVLELRSEKQVVQNLHRLDQLKDEFVANTSHELRTPLYGIIGIVESLLEGIAGTLPKRAIANLEMILTGGKRLARLVNDLLDSIQLENHSLVLRKRPVDLYALVDVVIRLSQPLIGNRDLLLQSEVGAELPAVDADEDRLQQILFNLVANAVKFTESGWVRVGAEVSNGQMLVSVTDTGIGISREHRADIFSPFRQADGSIAREYGGLGLGLAVTKQLVALHGGCIELTSEVNRGSTFSFTLPLATESAKPLLGPTMAQVELPLLAVADCPAEVEASTGGDYHILIVDDEPIIRQAIANQLSVGGYGVTRVTNGLEALKALDGKQTYDLVLLDIMMPQMSGYEVCRKLRETWPATELPVIFLTARKEESDLLTAFECGANDFLAKPVSKGELMTRVHTQLALVTATRALSAENRYLLEEIRSEHSFGGMIVGGKTFERVYARVAQVAPTDATVLICGETGTGKELLARAIHSLSPRGDRPMISVNCATLSANLIQSELFGHEKGAFTGATSRRIGRFELAHESTLFLDEIAEMPIELQAKLLRVLQERKFERLGGNRTIKVDFRLLAATNRNLEQAVEKGLFRRDLYFRLKVFPIDNPPLRQRKEDLPALIKHFLDKHGPRLDKHIETVSKSVMETLLAYSWPGNIRELENTIEHALIVTSGNALVPGDWLPAKGGVLMAGGPVTLAQVERDHIIKVLASTSGRVRGAAGAAAILGLKPTTLDGKMKKLGIKRP